MIERQNSPSKSTDMAAARRRGRPKGTGIDDAEILARVMTVLAVGRANKPTTAIKQIGISDPSEIRRLRDKLRSADKSFSLPLAIAPDAKRVAPKSSSRVMRATSQTPTTHPKGPAPTSPEPPQIAAASANSPPPIAGPTPGADSKDRETALLAAYLQAMMRSPPPQSPEPLPYPQRSSAMNSEPERPPLPPQPTPRSAQTHHAAEPQPKSAALHPFGGFTIPGMPNFLQPFLQSEPSQPTTGTPDGRQMEALKLAIEATTAIAKLQLHITQNAMSYSPMAMMLQGQSFMGQMMIASLTGQLGSMRRKITTEKD